MAPDELGPAESCADTMSRRAGTGSTCAKTRRRQASKLSDLFIIYDFRWASRCSRWVGTLIRRAGPMNPISQCRIRRTGTFPGGPVQSADGPTGQVHDAIFAAGEGPKASR